MVRIMTAKELIESDVPEISWLVKNLIPVRGVTIFAGDAGSCKTYIALYLAICCTNNTKVLDTFDTKKIKVLYLDGENGDSTLKTRIVALRDGKNLKNEDLQDLSFIVESEVKLLRGKPLEQLEKAISEHKPQLVIIDSLIRFTVADEDKSKDIKLVYDAIKSLIEKYNISFLILHHTRKGGSSRQQYDLRGSSDIVNFCDTVIILYKDGKDFVLKQAKNRHMEPVDAIKFRVVNTENEGVKFEALGTVKSEVAKAYEKAAENIRAWINSFRIKQFTTKAIMEELDDKHKESAVKEGLKLLEAQGFITKEYRGHWKVNSVNSVDLPT